jgi:hypothetical protein
MPENALLTSHAFPALPALPRRLVMYELARSQVDGHKVIRSFGGGTIGRRMILEPQLFRIDNYAEIIVLGIVVIFQDDSILSVR